MPDPDKTFIEGDATIENNFTHHRPGPGDSERYEAIRAKCKECAYLIKDLCPSSREQAVAITKLEEAMFWANAAVARN
jgi:hypothetical protein